MAASTVFPKIAPRLALFAAAAGAVACLWMAWCIFPCLAWNELRVAPAFALRHGINPYPPLGGGPLSTWIYGPVGIVADLPVTFATSPAGALHLASLITMLATIVPLAVIFFGSAELRARGRWAPWLALALGVLLVSDRNFLFQVPDESAIALGLLSGWCLTRRARPGAGALAVAAALCALAIASKQLAVFLVPAQLAYLWLGGNRANAYRYAAWLALFGVIGLVICIAAFGFDNLWLNLVAIPGRLPWADFAARFAVRPWILTGQVILPLAGLIALALARRWPDRATESGRFFHFAAFAFLTMLPVGLAAFFKIGGDTNTLHSWNYLLPGCLFAWFATDRLAGIGSARVLVVTALALGMHAKDLGSLPTHPLTEHFDDAAQLNATYPHAIWFPQNPLIGFYADQTLWHTEDGVRTRNLAGFAPRQADFRRHLPPNLQAIAYPQGEDPALTTALLSEFNRRTDLPHWILLTRTPSVPSATP